MYLCLPPTAPLAYAAPGSTRQSNKVTARRFNICGCRKLTRGREGGGGGSSDGHTWVTRYAKHSHTHTYTRMQATCTNLQKAAGNVHEINLQRRVPPKGVCERGWGTHKARVLLIQHDIARKMQKLNEGQLSVQLLFLLCRLLQQKSESGLNVFVRIRQRFHTCSSSTAAARRSGRGSALMAVVQWHKMPIRISSSQSVGPCAGIADALGAVCSFSSLRQPPRFPRSILASSPSLWLDFSQTQIVYRLQGTLLTLRPGPGRSRVRLGLSISMFNSLLLPYPVHSWWGMQHT